MTAATVAGSSAIREERYILVLARRFRRHYLPMAALAFVILLIILAVFAPAIAPYDPNKIDLSAHLQNPNHHHLLGTDQLGRDVLSRLIFGSRISLIAAAEVLLISGLLGIPIGMIAGYFGGRLDSFLARANDALISVPGLLLALTVIGALGPGLVEAMFAVGLILAPRFFRVSRAVTDEIVHETYIEASQSIGCRPVRVLGGHVLPNLLPNLVVQTSVILGTAVASEASLSFLGLGVPQPTASWGSMLSDGLTNITTAPYLVIAPSVVITVTVMAFTFVGDGISRALDNTAVRAEVSI
jgi:peptide/nickel transport system permease protein